jgi:hypothetical protein
VSADLLRRDHLAPQALEGRLAVRIASALAEQAERVPHDVAERLRVARDQAVDRARLARPAARAERAAAGSASLVVGRGATLSMAGAPVPFWRRAAAVLPLAVLLGGLLAVDRFAEREQGLAAAEVDTLLLTGDLPPAAYADPGFAEFLRSPPP